MDKIPKHLNLFDRNAAQIKRLLEIHASVAGSGRGYKHDVEVLNKSAIVLLVACWESYVENLAEQSFNILLKRSRNHKMIPSRVLVRVSDELINAKDKRAVWELAGEGWKKVLRNYKTRVLHKHIGSFSAPEPDNIDHLFLDLIGLKTCTNKWGWKGIDSKGCRNKLKRLVHLRHDIAHRVNASKPITKATVEDFNNFVFRLAAILSNDVRAHLHTAIGKYPWIAVKYDP